MTDLIWYGPPYSLSGYATHNREIVLRLPERGFNVRLIPTEDPGALEPKIQDRLIALTKTELKQAVPGGKCWDNTISISCIPPPGTRTPGRYSILYTTAETAGLHFGFANRCSLFDEIWFPCKMNYKDAKKAGLGSFFNMRIMPEGVDTHRFNPGIGKYPQISGINTTKLLYAGDWSWRKGVQFMVPVLRNLAKKYNFVWIIKAQYQGNDSQDSNERMRQEFDEYAGYKNAHKEDWVYWIDSFIPELEFPKVFNSVDFYISLTMGEAWCLPIIQAMACNVPVIATGFGGHMDYFDKRFGFPVRIAKFDIMPNQKQLCVDLYKWQKFCWPDTDHAEKVIEWCLKNKEKAKTKGLAGGNHVRKNFTWDKAADKIAARLKEIKTKL